MRSKIRPTVCKNEHLEYLDILRETGVTNMFGARPWLQNAYPDLSKIDARDILLYWMDSFSDRHISNGKDK